MRDRFVDWRYRWRGIQTQVETFHPDIVTLQEVQFTGFPVYNSPDSNVFKCDIQPWFSQFGYDMAFKQRTGGKDDGCAIFVDKSKFKITSMEEIEYKKNDPGLLDKDNIGLVVGLSPISPQSSGDTCVYVATTHLLFSPKRKEVRMAQTGVMLAHLDRIAWSERSRQYSPVILSGDFNLTPASSTYSLLSQGGVQHGYPGHVLHPRLGIADTCQFEEQLHSRRDQIMRESGTLSHNFGFRSVHHHHQGHHQEVTTLQNGWVTVDYIFYSTLPSRHKQSYSSDGRKEGKLKLLGRLSLPSAQQMALVGGLPNEHNPSDHLPLVADFLLSL